MLRQRRWMLVGAVTALHSSFDSLMSDNTPEMKEVTGPDDITHALGARFPSCVQMLPLHMKECETFLCVFL